MIKLKEIFWGWYVVTGAFVIMFITYGARYSFGVFVKPMFVEYQWPMTIISLAATINLITYAVTGILAGWLLDRMAPRWILTLGIVVTTGGLVSASLVTTPAGLYLSYGVLCGVGSAGSGVVVLNAAIGKWFVQKRGLAMGIATMGIGVGTLVMAPLAGFIVARFNWRSGFVFIALITLVCGSIVSQVFMGRKGPPEHDCKPDDTNPGDGRLKFSHGADYPHRSSIQQVMVNSRFWLLAVCNTVAVMTVMMTFVHQIAYAVNNGIDKVEAAAAMGVIGLTGGLGKFFFGWFSDRIHDAKYSAALGYFVMSVGMFILYRAGTGKMLYLFALIFGFGYGSLAPVMPYLILDRFGPQIMGAAYGLLIFFATGLGGAMGPLLGGMIFDKAGSYGFGWLVNSMVLLLVSFLILLLKPAEAFSSDPTKIKEAEQFP